MTAQQRIRVLVVEHAAGKLIESQLKAIPLVEPTCCSSLGEMMDTLHAGGPFDVLMVELSLVSDQLSALEQLQQLQHSIPLIILAPQNQEDGALQLLRRGAHDYLLFEDMTVDTTTRALRYALNISRLQRRVLDLDRHLEIANHRLRELFLPTTERLLDGPVGRRRRESDRTAETAGTDRTTRTARSNL